MAFSESDFQAAACISLAALTSRDAGTTNAWGEPFVDLDNHTTLVYRRKRADSALYEYQVFCTLSEEPQTVLDALMDFDYRKTWDKTVVGE